MEQIRDEWPNPTRGSDAAAENDYDDVMDPDPEDTNYCVGGAFLLSMGIRSGGEIDHGPTGHLFPSPGCLGEVLMEANPDLDPYLAKSFGRSIVKANDAGDYVRAWSALDCALSFTETEVQVEVKEVEEDGQVRARAEVPA